MNDAYIFDAVRTPRGRGRKDGSLHEVTAVRLSALTLNAIKERSGLDTSAVEDVIWGNATQVGEQGGCLARTAVLASDFDERVPGLSINRFCASGLEAVNLAANQVAAGAGQGYVAGGVEMMGRVPMGSDGAAIAVDPSVAMETYFVPQGISADIIATEYGFSRDDVDAFAVESQKRAAKAWEDGRFDRSVIHGPRPERPADPRPRRVHAAADRHAVAGRSQAVLRRDGRGRCPASTRSR